MRKNKLRRLLLMTGPRGSGSGSGGSSQIWRQLKNGPGGFVQGIGFANDGTKVVWKDAYGASIAGPGTASIWTEMLTRQSMPDWNIDAPMGVNDCAIAPSDSNIVYMAWNNFVYRSANKGASWTKTNFPTYVGNTAAVHEEPRAYGPRLAVDPANPNVVFWGPPGAKAYVSTDGGATATQITAFAVPGIPPFPVGNSIGGGTIFKFDPSSAVSGNPIRTQGIFASVNGTGVYGTTNAGIGWTLLNTANMPTGHRHMDIGTNGVLWLAGPGNLSFNYYKYTGGLAGTWSLPAPSGGGANLGWSVAVDPADPLKVYFVNSDGSGNYTTDGGTNWTRITTITRVAADVPWLANTNEGFFSNGDAHYDPSGSNRLYVAEGIGVWRNAPPSTTWNSQGAGIEELIGIGVVIPPGQRPLLQAEDRGVFRNIDLNTYPSNHGMNYVNQIQHAFGLDYAAGTPAFAAALVSFGDDANPDTSGTTTDNGATATWTPWPTKPSPFHAGGSIGVSSTTNWVVAQSNNGFLFNTKNGGTTWTQRNPTGVPTSGAPGWGGNAFIIRRIVAADRVTAGKFYAYNVGSDTPATATGLWVSTDGGDTWTRAFAGEIANLSGFANTLKSVPGQAGHLFFCSGIQSTHIADTDFMRSQDSGATWQAISGFKEVFAFGFGATYPGKTYPSIAAVGWFGSVLGIWESKDNAVSWQNIGDGSPAGIFCIIRDIEGDKQIPGVWFTAGNSGYQVRS